MSIIPKWMTFGGGGYDSITNAYINGMATKPAAAFIKIIDELVRDKETVNGVSITMKSLLSLLKFFYPANINDSNDSFRNLCSNAYHGTKEGSGLVWDSYWGYSNPSKTGYVDSHFNPATQGGTIFTQNAAGFGCYLHNNVASASSYPMGIKNTNTIGFQANTDSFAVNQLALLSRASMPFRAGLHGFFRTLSNAINAKNQNLANTTGSNASTSIPSGNIHLFNCNGLTAYYDGGLNCPYGGGVLTDDQFTALNIMVNRYLKKCLYLKYGADNWGVKMAKSYFDTLHNFEPYEAWEIYEFIKRMQPTYTDGSTTGYYYNTFGPSGQNKTVADFIMLFKAGGNLLANAWTKSGATLRWNQDGTITSSNTMPAYTRGTNLGIFTVSSVDGWSGLTLLSIPQAYISVNSFLGNFPNVLGTLKTSGSKLMIDTNLNKIRVNLIGQPLSTLLNYYIQKYSSVPGGLKMNIDNLSGGLYGTYIYTPEGGTIWSNIYGNLTNLGSILSTSTQYLNITNHNLIVGTLANLNIPDSLSGIRIYNTSASGGTSVWNKNVADYNASNCQFTTQAILDQLTVIKNQLTITAPIKNLTVNVNGSTMGIVAANHQLILDIAAQHVNANPTRVFTCTTRTS